MPNRNLTKIRGIVNQQLEDLSEEAKLIASYLQLPRNEIFLTRGQINGTNVLVMGPVPMNKESSFDESELLFLTVFQPRPFGDIEKTKWEHKRFDQILQLYHSSFKNKRLGQRIGECIFGINSLFFSRGELIIHFCQESRHHVYRVNKGNPMDDLAIELGARQYVFFVQTQSWKLEGEVASAQFYGTVLMSEEEGGDLNATITFSIPRELHDVKER